LPHSIDTVKMPVEPRGYCHNELWLADGILAALTSQLVRANAILLSK